MAQQTIHSTSKYIQPLENPTAYAKATFMDFAPASNTCNSCWVSEGAKKRTYAVMYDSKMEINAPLDVCCCCSTEQCLVDRVTTYYLDQPPFRTGMCCVCIPCTCCGPPVIYSKTPKFMCLDCSQCFGQQVWSAPANCYGLKVCFCCCMPCYQCFAIPCVTRPLVPGLSDSATFMSHMKAAADAYYLKHPDIDINQRALFEEVDDNIAFVGTTKAVDNNTMDRQV